MSTQNPCESVPVCDAHDEYTCADCIIAQVPWLPKRPQTVLFEESGYFKRLFANQETPPPRTTSGSSHAQCDCAEKNKIELQQHLVESIPFFLPARYHAMDSAQLHACATAPGSYWSNAIHFVVTCSNLSTILLYNFYKEREEPRHRINVRVKGSKCKYQEFKKVAPEQCETAAEFLLEPWVLLQLPFQPGLLHQWSVATMTESLRFSKKLVHLYTRGVAPKFLDVIDQMIDMNVHLYHTCTGAQLISFGHFCHDRTESLGTKMETFKAGFPKHMGPMLLDLDYILSNSCTDILNSIMRESWSKKVKPSSLDIGHQCKTISMIERGGDNIIAYTEHYWTNGPDTPGIGADGAISESFRIHDSTETRSFQTIFKENPEVSQKTKKNLKKIKSFLVEEILTEGGPLKGLRQTDVDKVLKILQDSLTREEFAMFMLKLSQWNSMKSIDGRAPHVEKGGVLIDLLSLKADVWAEHLLGDLTRCVWLAIEHLHNFQLDAGVTVSKSNYSARDIRHKLKILSLREKKWSFESLTEAARSTCKLTGVEKDDPYLSTDANMLQEYHTRRIRLLVLKVYEVHYSSSASKDGLRFHPEHHYIQYILPCFVAMILDVDKDSKVCFKVKNEYKQFVHELIKSYEEHPYSQCLDKNRKWCFYGRVDFKDLRIRFNKVVNTLSNVFKESAPLQCIVRKISYLGSECFDNVLLELSTSCEAYTEENIERDFYCQMDSKINLSLFCCRIAECFDKVGWSSNKDLSILGFLEAFSILTDSKTSTIEKVLLLSLAGIGQQSQIDISEAPAIMDSIFLTSPQHCGIVVFLVWKYKMSPHRFFEKYQKPLFELDPVQLVTKHFLDNDWWNVALKMAPHLKGNLSLIPLDMALRNACCEPLLSALTLRRDRVRMSSPGAVTFCPIQHCRWCGLADVKTFRLCPECQDEPDYPLINYFCSEKCEKTALDKLHTEEHARFVMKKLGIC